MGYIKIKTPIDNDEEIRKLKAGDSVLINGVIYTARDAAHKRLIELINKGRRTSHGFKRTVHILCRTGSG